MPKPKFDTIIKMMEGGKSFELTSQEYKKKTGADFPKDKSYAERRSAMAKRAKAYGYSLEVIPLHIKFKKI